MREVHAIRRLVADLDAFAVAKKHHGVIADDIAAADRLEADRLAIACTGVAVALGNRAFGELAADTARHSLAPHPRRSPMRSRLMAAMRLCDTREIRNATLG